MQRYFVSKDQMNETKVVINGEDVHHITKVMRNQIGDKLICCNGQGRDVIATILSIDSKEVICSINEVISENREPAAHLILVQGLPKADKMDLIIQKGTEIGVSQFLPFISQRTIVKLDEKKEKKRLERWGKIAKEAAEQAHRSIIPSVEQPMSWKQLMAWIKGKKTLIAYEKENTVLLSRIMRSFSRPTEIILIIGPEGGFSEKEIDEAEQNGAMTISLGKRILRTETAGLVGAANIIYHLEELEG